MAVTTGVSGGCQGLEKGSSRAGDAGPMWVGGIRGVSNLGNRLSSPTRRGCQGTHKGQWLLQREGNCINIHENI